MHNSPDWCHDCAEGWDYHRSLGVALCPLHRAAPVLLEALEEVIKVVELHVPKSFGYDFDILKRARAVIAQANDASRD